MYSKVVDPALLPAMKAQRDPKTGQLKDEPSFIKHRMDLFDQLYKEPGMIFFPIFEKLIFVMIF